MDPNKALLATVGLLAIFYSVESVIEKRGTPESIKFTVSQNESVKGQKVTLKCWIHQKDRYYFIYIIRKNKGIKPVTVSNYLNQNEFFSKNERYKGHFKRDGESAQFTLQITDVQGEDTGMYECGCHMYNHRSMTSSSINLTVLVPPKSVSIRETPSSLVSVPGDDTGVHLYEGRPSGFQCVIDLEGSVFEPEQIQFKIGNENLKSLQGSTYESDYPKRYIENRLEKIIHKVMWKYNTTKPKASYSGKNVTCSVKMQGVEPVTSRAKVTVYYEAKFSPSHCKSQQWPRHDSSNSTLRCRVKMNPSPTDWKWTSETLNTLGRTDNQSQTVKQSEFWAFQQPKGDEEYEFTLTMKRFDESYYNLTVTNSMGTVTKTITLTKKSDVMKKKIAGEGMFQKSSMLVGQANGASTVKLDLVFSVFILFGVQILL